MPANLALPGGHVLSPDDIVREVKHLPSAPKVLPRLKTLLSDGNSAMHEIVAFVRLDPGIAARVLQVANSAYYAKGVRCFTVDEAVHRVGYDQVYELVSYAVASQVLVRPLEVYRIDADELWRMSVAGAIAAELLADRTGQDRNAAYTVGLLHCVGMVAIDEWALRNARSLVLPLAAFPREATEGERAAFGFTQADTGGALLRDWGFPASIVEPVRWQYAPRASASQVRMATLLHAAKWIRNAVCGRRATPLDSGHIQPLGISPAKVEALAEKVAERIAQVSSLLDETENFVADRGLFPAQSWDQ
ncbi:MAG: HDOD domain-containing protein [Verrucomicrobia bacterium]|nr:HDOD domain-containing protein [Verrucomicrobiota bacterium]